MFKRILYLLLLSTIADNCFSQSTMMGKGVLRINLNSFEEGHRLPIYNKDGSFFAELYRDTADSEYKVRFRDPKKTQKDIEVIRDWSTDHGLCIMDSEGLVAGQYPVYIGKEVKYIKLADSKKRAFYQTWPSFIKDIFVKATAATNVYTDTTAAKKVIKEANERSYRTLKMAGDWVYVECLKTCEDCPPNRIIRGWIRWRQNNTLLVDLYYFC